MAFRNPFEPRPITSRRGGPVKQPLSRDAIVAAALDLLTREGLKEMSLRKVAAALDTGAASLYVYVEDLQELRSLVFDRALAAVDTKLDPKQPWRGKLRALLESYFNALQRSPGIAQLALSTFAVGPNGLRFFEALLGVLEEGGVGQAAAAWALDLIPLYVTAIAAEQANRNADPHPQGALQRLLESLSKDDYPRLHAVRRDLLSGGPEERFMWALDVLLKGILETPRSASPSRPGSPSRR
jgi:AcrR family transcriptional regulator